MRVGFIYNIDYCTGCKACQVACKDKNDLPAGRFFRRVESLVTDGKRVNYSGACNHCKDAPCLEGCPSGALFRAADGSVGHHGGRCIGCGACVWLCPYGAPFLSPSKGISQKCDSCFELRAKGIDPACVRACITHCLTFGPLPEDASGAILCDDEPVAEGINRVRVEKGRWGSEVEESPSGDGKFIEEADTEKGRRETGYQPPFLPDARRTSPALLIQRDARRIKPALAVRRGTKKGGSANDSVANIFIRAGASPPFEILDAQMDRALYPHSDTRGRIGMPALHTPGGNAAAGGLSEDARVLIIGGGAAGLSAAAAVRARNPFCDIVILSAEDHLSYGRPMLTKAALRGFDASAFTVFDEDWYLTHRMDFRKNIAAMAIDPVSAEVTLSDGSVLSYDRCIIATGAECFIPPIPGRELKRVFGIRDLKSIRAIRSALTTARKVVVIGGGVIGLEMAWEIKRTGCELTILELAPTLMGRLLDGQSADRLANQLKRIGVTVRTGIKIEEIYASETDGIDASDDHIAGNRVANYIAGDRVANYIAGDRVANYIAGDRVAGVRLADGTDFEADMVVISCGIAPNTGIAKAAGCATNRGILVNSYMETSVPGIYACGDCAEQENSSGGLWQTAVSQGAAVGAVAAGERKACVPEPAGLLMHGFETCLYALGDAGKNPDLEYEVLEFERGSAPEIFLVNGIQRNTGVERYFFVEDRLVGGVLMGNLLSMASLKKGIAEGLGTAAFQSLREGGG